MTGNSMFTGHMSFGASAPCANAESCRAYSASMQFANAIIMIVGAIIMASIIIVSVAVSVIVEVSVIVAVLVLVAAVVVTREKIDLPIMRMLV